MNSKTRCLGCHSRSSNSIRGYKVATLHLLLSQKPPIASCPSADESTCAFHPFIPFLTSAALLETERPFRICHAARGQRKSAICTSMVYGLLPVDRRISVLIAPILLHSRGVQYPARIAAFPLSSTVSPCTTDVARRRDDGEAACDISFQSHGWMYRCHPITIVQKIKRISAAASRHHLLKSTESRRGYGRCWPHRKTSQFLSAIHFLAISRPVYLFSWTENVWAESKLWRHSCSDWSYSVVTKERTQPGDQVHSCMIKSDCFLSAGLSKGAHFGWRSF